MVWMIAAHAAMTCFCAGNAIATSHHDWIPLHLLAAGLNFGFMAARIIDHAKGKVL